MLAAIDTAGELVGHVMLTTWPDHGLGLIGRVLVDPERRGSGLGGALMSEIVRVGFDEAGLHRPKYGSSGVRLASATRRSSRASSVAPIRNVRWWVPAHSPHAVRAELLGRLGRCDDAATAYREAIGLTGNGVEVALLQKRLTAIYAA
ncbi:MAG: GNAT family N-acetyltransferase [Solirubrobacterales bacterium]|nr:GNAT family N-acetyltransferase [Solirubrobacterales bacterium]